MASAARSIGKLAEAIRRGLPAKPDENSRLGSGTLILRLLFIRLAFSTMDRHTRCAYSVIDVCDSSFDPLFHFSPSLSLSLSFSREPIGNYAEQSKTEREKREEESMQLRGLVLLHEYPIMTDYRGINSLFNQQTTYPACRLSNKIWRPWPRAPNDSLPPFSLVFARSSTRLPIARSLHFARGPFLTAA